MSDAESIETLDDNRMFVCWTTVPNEAEGRLIAEALVSESLAACVQIDGPMQSFYRWEGACDSSLERRLWIKALEPALEAVRKRVFELHSYDTPQWIAVEATKVDEKYLKWAKDVSNLRGFQKREPI